MFGQVLLGVTGNRSVRSVMTRSSLSRSVVSRFVAGEDVDAALSAVNAASGTFTSKEDKATYDAAVKAHDATKKKLKDLRTSSGTQTVQKGAVADDVIGAGTTDFRDAVKKDGKNVSKYAEKDWQDSFAEAYSLYLSAPSELLLLRPATHAYFVKAMPK